jgi:hypothetical protein
MPPVKVVGPGEAHEIDRFDGGVGWIAHPEEVMERAGHALATDDGVYLTDPLDADGLDDLVAEFGTVAGVVVLLEYHTRHADRIAARHDVPVYTPEFLVDDVASELDAPVEGVSGTLGATDYELVPVTVNALWKEGALYDGETLVVAESVGAAAYFRTDAERVGVSHMRRPWPPAALRGLHPERLLLGHGEGVTTDAATVLRRALDNARPSTLRFYRQNFPTYLRTLSAASDPA